MVACGPAFVISMPALLIHFVTALLAAFGLYSFWAAYDAGSLLGASWGVFALAGAVALAGQRPWSGYFVYLITAATIVSWVILVAISAANDWPFEGVGEGVLDFVPDVLWIGLWIAASAIVFRHFRRRR